MAVYNISEWFNVYTIFIATLVVLLLPWSFKKRKNFPPGPWSLPLIGCVPSLAYTMYRSRDEAAQMLAKMSNRYGEVFCLHIGPKVIVVLNGYKTISEAFKNPLLNDRPFNRTSAETKLHNGIGSACGKSWITLRKLTLNILRKLSVGRNSFEGSISKEAQNLCDLMNAKQSSPFDPRIMIGNCVSNITCAVLFGKRYDHADPEFEQILNLFGQVFTQAGVGGIMTMLPLSRFVFPKQYQMMLTMKFGIRDLLDNIIKERGDTFDGSARDDFIDIFRNEIELNENKESSQYINHDSLIATCYHLYNASIETTTSTLLWAFLYMMLYPDIQSKVQKELEDVLGRERMPQWDDRRDLPYTESVLLEVQRIRTTAPIVPHCAAEDTTLAGYNIPKDALVMANIWAVHNNPDLWFEPDQFKPERFVDDNGKANVPEEYIPFGTGRRMCIGENLAKMELFIFFTYVLHKFNIRKISPEHCYSLEGTAGIGYTPLPYEIVAEIRD